MSLLWCAFYDFPGNYILTSTYIIPSDTIFKYLFVVVVDAATIAARTDSTTLEFESIKHS